MVAALRLRIGNSLPTFESQAQHPDLLAFQHPHSAPDFLQEYVGTSQVNFLYFLKQPTTYLVLARQMHEGPKVLGETVAAETDASVQKLTSDPGVEPHSERHLGDVGADRLADVSHHVDEGNFGGWKGIRRVLGQFRRADVGKQNRGPQRLIELLEQNARSFGFHSYYDAVRTEDVLKCFPLLAAGGTIRQFPQVSPRL